MLVQIKKWFVWFEGDVMAKVWYFTLPYGILTRLFRSIWDDFTSLIRPPGTKPKSVSNPAKSVWLNSTTVYLN